MCMVLAPGMFQIVSNDSGNFLSDTMLHTLAVVGFDI